MLNTKVYCLLVTGIPLPETVKDQLFIAAYEMLRQRERRSRIRSDDGEGIVTTKFERYGLGSIFGTEFEAEVETKRGKGRVSYLVRDEDLMRVDHTTFKAALEQGRWEPFDLQDMARAAKAQFN